MLRTFNGAAGSLPRASSRSRGVNGDIAAEPSAGSDVEVKAVKTGRRSDPAEVKIEVVEHDAGVTICAVYPSRDPGRPNECKPGGAGRMNVNNNDVSVDFSVRVPAGVKFIGRTVNGAISASLASLKKPAEFNTVNGGITLELPAKTGAELDARTVNGRINLRQAP